MTTAPWWLPLAAVAFQVLLIAVFVPLSMAAFRGTVQALISAHNDAQHAHPNLNATATILDALEAIRRSIADMRVAIASLGSNSNGNHHREADSPQ